MGLLSIVSRFCPSQEIERHDRGRGSRLNPELAQDSFYVLADGALTRLENRGNFTIPFPLANPKQNFCLSFGETERLQRLSFQSFVIFALRGSRSSQCMQNDSTHACELLSAIDVETLRKNLEIGRTLGGKCRRLNCNGRQGKLAVRIRKGIWNTKSLDFSV
jgi:hypothetical protein